MDKILITTCIICSSINTWSVFVADTMQKKGIHAALAGGLALIAIVTAIKDKNEL